MENIEKYKHLFVPLSERLPEIAEENYITILDGELYARETYFNGIRFSQASYEPKVTHWLDWDLLTTKKLAEKLARHAYNEGRIGEKESLNASEHGNTFLSQNKDRL